MTNPMTSKQVEAIIAEYEGTTAMGRIMTRCASRDIQERSYFEDLFIKKTTCNEVDAKMFERVINEVYGDPTEQVTE
jgi:hypothetical protein